MNFIKRIVRLLSITIISMLIIPIITINTVKADAGMLVTLMLFFAVYPVVSVVIGIISGEDVKHFWFSPAFIAVLFWVFSSFTYKTAFPVLYSILYFLLCLISMLMASFIKKRKG